MEDLSSRCKLTSKLATISLGAQGCRARKAEEMVFFASLDHSTHCLLKAVPRVKLDRKKAIPVQIPIEVGSSVDLLAEILIATGQTLKPSFKSGTYGLQDAFLEEILTVSVPSLASLQQEPPMIST